MSKIWFVTGSSRGFGRQFVEAALSRGDKVAATARDIATVGGLAAAHGDAVLPLALDVTDRAAVTAALKRAHEHFGRLDIVVNNAGHGLSGTVEELREQDVRDQFETNVFGALWVTQAALPYLRAQGSGHIIQISSTLGVAAVPTRGGYSATKWALEGLSDALAQEVAGFGIKITLVEPAAFGTDFTQSSTRSELLPAYDGVRQAVAARFGSIPVGEPDGVGPALLKVVDADSPPLRIFFGSYPFQLIHQVYADRLKTWDDWAEVSAEAEAGVGRG